MVRLVRYAGLALAFLWLGSAWPLVSARFKVVLPLYESRILPDFVPVPQALGFPATGLSLAPDGSLWAGVGLTDASDLAGVVNMSRDMTQVRRIVTVRDLGLPAGSVQGVTAGQGRICFILKNNPRAKLVEIDADGRLLRTADFKRGGANGLAFDSRRNALIVLYDDGLVQWLDAATLRPTGMRFVVGHRQADHLFVLAEDRLLVSWGANGKDGHVSVYGLPDFRELASWSMQSADAIEGLVADQGIVTVMNDAGTHEGLPRVNRGLEYRLPPI